MATMSLRSAASHPSFSLRRRSGGRKIQTNFSPELRKPPQIRVSLRLAPKAPIFSHKMDDWVHESAAEIVRNIRKAPLLVQIHVDGTVETAAAEGWDTVAGRWREGAAREPAGVMLVDAIGVVEREGEDEEERESSGVWGILVQGKGAENGPRCYLLKTSRVGSGLGFGYCTHFCLTKVRDFRESAMSQLDSCWLLN